MNYDMAISLYESPIFDRTRMNLIEQIAFPFISVTKMIRIIAISDSKFSTEWTISLVQKKD